jgi:hypothetical protein
MQGCHFIIVDFLIFILQHHPNYCKILPFSDGHMFHLIIASVVFKLIFFLHSKEDAILIIFTQTFV